MLNMTGLHAHSLDWNSFAHIAVHLDANLDGHLTVKHGCSAACMCCGRPQRRPINTIQSQLA
jgi:hypothetical protein